MMYRRKGERNGMRHCSGERGMSDGRKGMRHCRGKRGVREERNEVLLRREGGVAKEGRHRKEE